MAKEGYQGKYFSVLGDSISTLAGYNPPECGVYYDWPMKRCAGILGPEDTWWGRVIAELGGQLLVNHSWAGSTVCRMPGYEIESYGCSDARTGALGTEGRDPDVVMILMGLNDLGLGVALSAFSAAYGLMLQKIQRHYPQTEIWCLTLPDVSGVGARVEGYNQTICAVAAQNGCRSVDIFCGDVVCETVDGYHPTARGMQMIAEMVLKRSG